MPRQIEDYLNDVYTYLNKFQSALERKSYFKADDYLDVINENMGRILMIVAEKG